LLVKAVGDANDGHELTNKDGEQEHDGKGDLAAEWHHNRPGAARSDKPTARAQCHARSGGVGGGVASRMPGSGGKRAEASHLWVGSLAACSWGLAANKHVCGGGQRAPPIFPPLVLRRLGHLGLPTYTSVGLPASCRWHSKGLLHGRAMVWDLHDVRCLQQGTREAGAIVWEPSFSPLLARRRSTRPSCWHGGGATRRGHEGGRRGVKEV